MERSNSTDDASSQDNNGSTHTRTNGHCATDSTELLHMANGLADSMPILAWPQNVLRRTRALLVTCGGGRCFDGVESRLISGIA